MCLSVSEPTVVSIGPFTESMPSFKTSHSFLLSDTTLFPHNCMDITSCSSKPHPNLSETPLANSDLVFYTDGSDYRENGVPLAGYAICDNFSIIESAALPPSSSAQVAELYALTRACHLAKGKTVTVYTKLNMAN